MQRIATAVLVSLLPTILAAQDEARHTLRPSCRPGQRFSFVEQVRQDVEVRTDPTPTKRSIEIERFFLIEVTAVADDGGMTLLLTNVRVHGAVDMPAGPARRFDSLDAELQSEENLAGLGEPVRSRLAEAGTAFTARIDADCRVVGELKPPPKFAKQAPLDDDQQQRLKRLVESVFGRTTKGPVVQGATWQHEIATHDRALPTVQRTDVTLKEVRDDAYLLAIAGTVRTAPGVADGDKVIRIDGKLTGTQTIERRTGVVRDMQMTADSKLELPGMAGVPATMTVRSQLRRASEQDRQQVRELLRRATTLSMQAAKLAKTQADVRILAMAVRAFFARNGQLPGSLDALAEPDARGRSELDEVPDDAWGNPYELVRGAEPQDFHVLSLGPDGRRGTADDIRAPAAK
ncbi:MAG: type II secretion system protein GspG [Planctomycetes bacterium]|nr:type II secretion system protein GspG [Planctomycetota bacterium]